MTKENKNKLLYGFLWVTVSGGIVYALIKLNKYFASMPSSYPGYPGPTFPTPAPTSGLNKANPLLVNSITGIPCTSSSSYGCKTSSYGPRGGRFHYGMDIRTRGTGSNWDNWKRNIVINVPGEVVSAVNTVDNTGWGKRIGIKTDNGDYLLFAHLDNVFVTKGMRVYPYDIIGISGVTSKPGSNVAPHVHFEVCKKSCDNIPGGKGTYQGGGRYSNYDLYKVDPIDYINTWSLS
tara:strand:+ start:6851 stop:7552 length:702 start_codon:yes stop_codon:yes gene_type:complete